MGSENVVLLRLSLSHVTLVSTNPIFGNGQKVIITDIPKAVKNPTKIGNGVTAYNSLPFTEILQLQTASAYDLTQAFLAVDSNEVEIKNINSSAAILITTGGTDLSLDAGESAKFRRISGSWSLYKNNLASDIDANITHRSTNITESVSAHGIQQGSGNGFDADTLDGTHKVNILANTIVYTITTAVDVVHALPDATLTENQHIVKRRGDGAGVVTFTTVSGQTIDTLAASELELSGDSAIILIPKGGNWESVKTGGASGTVVGIAGEAIAAGKAVYFNAAGDVVLADNSIIASANASGFALNSVSLGEGVSVQSNGLLEEFSSLVVGTRYFLGSSGNIIVEGSLPATGFKQQVGVAVSTTGLFINLSPAESTKYNDNAPLGVSSDYFGTTPPPGWEWIPVKTTTKLRSMYQQFWTSVLNSIDWFAPDAAAAAAAASAGTFHFPTLHDQYVRGGFHATATFANATNSVALVDQNGEDVDDTWLNGTPIRFIGGTLPTGLTAWTTYYLGWNVSGYWNIYNTAFNGETNNGSTGLMTFTTDGSGVTGTQFGITLDDQMQRITGSFSLGDGQGAREGTSFTGAIIPGTSITSRVTGEMVPGLKVALDTSFSPNARASATTDGETRPRTAFMRKIIKVSSLLPTGEPVTAVKYDTGWIVNSDWTNAELIVTHNLNVDLTDAIVKFFISVDGTANNAFELIFAEEALVNMGAAIFQISSNSYKIQTGSAGVPTLVGGSGAVVTLVAQTYYYKVVVYKPTILSSVINSAYRTITNSNWTVGIQDATNFNFDTGVTDRTLTIPDGLPIGTRLTVRKITDAVGTVTIARGGTDVFTRASLTSVTLPSDGDFWVLEKVTPARWELTDGYGFDVNWHYIGATGEPAFENGWVDYGGIWGSPRFRKTSSGMIDMQGLVKAGTVGTTIFTLPKGYRPNAGLHFPVAASSSGSVNSPYLYVLSNGKVYPHANLTNTWVSLAGCSFYAK